MIGIRSVASKIDITLNIHAYTYICVLLFKFQATKNSEELFRENYELEQIAGFCSAS